MKPTKRKAVVAIGTRNPVKVSAVKKFFKRVFPKKKFNFVPVEVPGAPSQPFDSETLGGAKTRALESLKLVPEAEYGVGVEGGIRTIGSQSFIEGWVAVSDRAGKVTLGFGGGPILPSALMRKIVNERKEMGVAADELLGTKDIKHSIGMMGISTGGLITREDAFVYAGTIALASRDFLGKFPD